MPCAVGHERCGAPRINVLRPLRMQTMPLVLHPFDIAARIAVCLIVGAIIGLNRGESGKAAGLRTVMLVCLAA
ncbi:MgtC/SapB family protein, partial [Burkholderia gladioli]|uniref:MgtC/SapB family protein n=1 Tax=Burkholderia gladioli TaxID=28095 RepID=UPI003F7A88E6